MKKPGIRRIILAVLDTVICLASLIVCSAGWNASNGNPGFSLGTASPLILLIVSLIHFAVFSTGGVYNVLWRLAGVFEAMQMIGLEALSAILTIIAGKLLGWKIPTYVLAVSAMLSVLVILASRFVWRLISSGRFRTLASGDARSIMVVGAGEAGAYVLAHYKKGANEIILIDDDPDKQGLRVHGVLVRGQTGDIPKLCEAYGVEQIIIAIPSLSGPVYSSLVATCSALNTKVRVLTAVDDETGTRRGGKQKLAIRDVNVSDFLPRDEIKLDPASISDYLTGQVILVTGGGGSIGSEIVRQALRFNPAKIYIYDIYENNAYALLKELSNDDSRDRIEVLIGSVRDKKRLGDVFSLVCPDVVFHAAAHKHVPLMETSPGEAVKNNIFGTRNTLEAAQKAGVKRFVLLSTDKAVNPTNVMGASKRVCEMLVQQYAAAGAMKCMAVRFGNVLGSYGSVIPLFEAQIRAGGPVTVTDPEVTRYFMTIPEAAQLVLQAGGIAQSGAIYILDMGEPVLIQNLAENLIRFHGFRPGEDIQIIHTGLRSGEKMHEELMTGYERKQLIKTPHKKILITPPEQVANDRLEQTLSDLWEAAEKNPDAIRGILSDIVAGYEPFAASVQAVGKPNERAKVRAHTNGGIAYAGNHD